MSIDIIISVSVIALALFFMWSVIYMFTAHKEMKLVKKEAHLLRLALDESLDVEGEHIRIHRMNQERLQKFLATLTPDATMKEVIDNFTEICQVDLYSYVIEHTEKRNTILDKLH